MKQPDDFTSSEVAACSVPTTSITIEKILLIHVYKNLGGGYWTKKWHIGKKWKPFEKWHGVKVDPLGRVTGLDFCWNGLVGKKYLTTVIFPSE